MGLTLLASVAAVAAMLVARRLHGRKSWDLDAAKTLLEIGAIAAGAVWLVGHYAYELEGLRRRTQSTGLTLRHQVLRSEGQPDVCRLDVKWGIENIGQRTVSVEQATFVLRRYAHAAKPTPYVEDLKSVRETKPIFGPFDLLADEPLPANGLHRAEVAIGQKISWARVVVVAVTGPDKFLVETSTKLEGDPEPWRETAVWQCL